MLAIQHIHDEADLTDIVLRNQISNMIFLMLPGLVATLTNVALGDEKQGTALIAVSNRFVDECA